MSLSQTNKLTTPDWENDKKLETYTLNVQGNLETLFRKGHEHSIKNVIPSTREGSPGDILIYTDGSVMRLYIKVSKDKWGYLTLTEA